MKKTILLIGLIGISFGIKAQNTFPTTGNVGIGTTTPNAKLEIGNRNHGSTTGITNAFFTGTNFNLSLYSDQIYNSNGITGTISFGSKYNSSGTYTSGVKIYGFRPNYQTAGNYEYALGIDTRTHGGSSSRKFTILGNGNVGIGTSNPSMKLQVVGSVASGYNNTLSLDKQEWFNFGNKSGYGFINWFSQANADRNGFINTHSSVKASSISGGNGEIKFYTSLANNGIGQSSSLVERMTIESNGYVGIGTMNPDMKLTVKGNIHAEEVKIDLNVPAPDYVFKKDYNLRSIEEVERFIKKNSHLPEIPSAKEFEQNGVMLAEMDMNLLKKIEELTLYTIRQDKKIKNLERKNEELNSINKKLIELQLRLEKLESEK
ncbi:hypothetical protein IWQ47_000148 [Aquimarina sp. EL_43]|uniref:tail fiber protein n=1 Tax=unclassified Aquimarina TaxID=2627091 RepID=UPI0018CB0016|nr:MULTISPECIES: tail fiber protein [unclassified Aquimarina]MBG6129160.1 hypothetical protein [Aquimarina sp. EL_35]MBG6150225.1 hypothetical protein [Aquimarina sp. EL_32]MBG6167090.1 hypothetical protein [Aquimarina sp. EL_43]